MSTKTKGLVAFLAIAFGMAWTFWGMVWLLGLSPGHPLFQFAILPGSFAPAMASLIVRQWVTGEGFADAGLRPNLQKWPYYLFAWLHPLIVALIVVGLAAVLGLSQPDLTLRRAIRALVPGAPAPPPFPPALWALVPVQFLLVSLIATPLLWGEEFGWRGYLQMRLLSHRPLLAAVVSGLIWGVWHYPLTLMGYHYPDDVALGLVVFPVGTVLLSILFGWLRLRTGSVWAPSLAHAATNAVGASLLTLLFLGGPNWILVSYFGVLGWLPLGALCAWIVLSGQLKLQEILACERALRAWFTRDADPLLRQIDGLDIGWGGVQRWATARMPPLGEGPHLDLACGYGTFLAQLGWRFPATRLVGLNVDFDGAHALVRPLLAEAGVSATLVQADARRMPFADGAFASASCFLGLQDIEIGFGEGGVRGTLAEAVRVLRHGGLLVLLDEFPADRFAAWLDGLAVEWVDRGARELDVRWDGEVARAAIQLYAKGWVAQMRLPQGDRAAHEAAYRQVLARMQAEVEEQMSRQGYYVPFGPVYMAVLRKVG